MGQVHFPPVVYNVNQAMYCHTHEDSHIHVWLKSEAAVPTYDVGSYLMIPRQVLTIKRAKNNFGGGGPLIVVPQWANSKAPTCR